MIGEAYAPVKEEFRVVKVSMDPDHKQRGEAAVEKLLAEGWSIRSIHPVVGRLIENAYLAVAMTKGSHW